MNKPNNDTPNGKSKNSINFFSIINIENNILLIKKFGELSTFLIKLIFKILKKMIIKDIGTNKKKLKYVSLIISKFLNKFDI